MTQRNEEARKPLSLEEVAILADGTDQVPARTAHRLAGVVRTHPDYTEDVEALEELAREAGLDPDRGSRLGTAVECHKEFERLLAAEGWDHPAEVLDPEGEVGFSYPELVHIADARASRGDDGDRVLAIKDKLERAWSAERLRRRPVAAFVSHLVGQDPAVAEQLINQAGLEYRNQIQKSEG